jgi:hypothetical protein
LGTSGKLTPHLSEIQRTASFRQSQMTRQITSLNLPEAETNNLKLQAEQQILTEVVYA